MSLWVWLGFVYLLGSVPFGVLLTRWKTGKDVRGQGSGNIGATNVARVGGKKLALVVLLLDAVKGAAPVGAMLKLRPEDTMLHAATALAAVLGHVFSIWLKGRGGKGVATALGVMCVLMPLSAIAGVVSYGLVLKRFRYSSVGSLTGVLVALGVALLRQGPMPYLGLMGVLALLIAWTHRANFRRLARNAEHKL